MGTTSHKDNDHFVTDWEPPVEYLTAREVFEAQVENEWKLCLAMLKPSANPDELIPANVGERQINSYWIARFTALTGHLPPSRFRELCEKLGGPY